MGSRELMYLGNAGFLITTGEGTRVLIDPFITGNPLCPLRVEDVPNPDLILTTHGAPDHFGDTLKIAQRSSCTVLGDPAVFRYLLRAGIPRERLQLGVWGFLIKFRDVAVKVVETRHTSSIAYEQEVFTGIPLGFILNTGSDPGIYHPGDTSVFSEVKTFAQLYKPEIGLLPIGGAAGHAGMSAELWPPEAALMAQWMQLKVAIPMHYSTDAHPQEFAQQLRSIGSSTKVLLLKPGEKAKL